MKLCNEYNILIKCLELYIYFSLYVNFANWYCFVVNIKCFYSITYNFAFLKDFVYIDFSILNSGRMALLLTHGQEDTWLLLSKYLTLFECKNFPINYFVPGNIALHIFSDKARDIYDLETLWAVGPEYDEQINKKSEVVDMFENYSTYLKDLKPLA